MGGVHVVIRVHGKSVMMMMSMQKNTKNNNNNNNAGGWLGVLMHLLHILRSTFVAFVGCVCVRYAFIHHRPLSLKEPYYRSLHVM